MKNMQYPYFLLLLLPLALAVFAAWKMRQPSITVPFLKPFAKAAGKKRFDTRKAVPLLCFALGAALLACALARPREGTEMIRSKADGIDIIVALDLSGSMEAIDLSGPLSESALRRGLADGTLKNRLETAKLEVARFIETRPADRIGLVVFADEPYVVCPPTLDHAFLLANLARMKTGEIGSATGIAGPVASALKRLKDSDAKGRIIVLFTDGANTAPQAVTPREAAKMANQFDIRVYTVGIGSRYAVAPFDDPFYGSGFTPVRNEFDERLLKDMAAVSGGRYYPASDSESMAAAMNDINRIEKTTVEQNIHVNWKELYPFFCAAAVIFLFAGTALKSLILQRIP